LCDLLINNCEIIIKKSIFIFFCFSFVGSCSKHKQWRTQYSRLRNNRLHALSVLIFLKNPKRCHVYILSARNVLEIIYCIIQNSRDVWVTTVPFADDSYWRLLGRNFLHTFGQTVYRQTITLFQ
jgi:hypothetical protein